MLACQHRTLKFKITASKMKMLHFSLYGVEYSVALESGRMIGGVKKSKSTITCVGDEFSSKTVCSVDDQPALYYDNGSKSYCIWMDGGIKHRDDGPAYVKKKNGVVVCEYWINKGRIHNARGPAVVYYLRGRPVRELWYRYDRYLGSKLNSDGLTENECLEIARLRPFAETSIWR
jgi:hypothetical protein